MGKDGLARKLVVGGTTVAATVAVIGCEDSVEPDDPPQIILWDVTPRSLVRGEEVRVRLTCDDDRGVAEYRVTVGGDVLGGADPIDTTLTPSQDTDATARCVDTGGQEATAGPIRIEVLQPSLAQVVEVVRDVDIEYGAVLTNVFRAALVVVREADTVWTRTIMAATYEETFEGVGKGAYQFILEALDLSDTASAEIPEYLPEADLDSVAADLVEGSQLVIDLPPPTDRNPEDSLVPYVSARSLDGKVTIVALVGNQLTVQGNGEAIGPYGVELEFGSQGGGIALDTLSGSLLDLVHVTGQLQDARTDSAAFGRINVYRDSISENTFLGQAQTDTEGNFDFKLTEHVPGSSLIYLASKLDSGDYPDSNYTRIISLTPKDTTGLIIRPFNYTRVLADTGVSREDFRKHLEEINPGFFKWNLDSLQGIEIIDVDPLGRGSFTPTEQSSFERTILESSCYFEGRQIYIQKDDSTTQRNYTIKNNGIRLDRNWIFVFPDSTVEKDNTASKDLDVDGYIDLVLMRIKNQDSEYIKAHELGHAFIAPNYHHASTLTGLQTIMRTSSLRRPGPADCEAARVVHEPTYPPKSSIDNLLGLTFREDGQGGNGIMDYIGTSAAGEQRPSRRR